jgi:hypothetical protein
MLFKVEVFKNMPFVGKLGSILCAVSWIWIIAICYFMLSDKNWAFKLSIMVVILSFFLFQAQNWARWVAVLGDALGILLSGYFYIGGFVSFAVVNALLFGASLYCLTAPVTSQYFKAHSQHSR